VRRTLLAALALAAVSCDAAQPRVLSTTALADTRDTTGPYPVTIVARGVTDDDDVQLLWSSGGEDGPYVAIAATDDDDDRDDLFTALIPGQPAGTEIHYFATIVRGADVVSSETPVALSFRVLSPSIACRADSDCRLGLEICMDGTCRAWAGTCVEDGAGGFGCPGGHVCDVTHDPPVCAIAPRPCDTDDECPTVERCDPDRDECRARLPCATTDDCELGDRCDTSLGLCFAD
jgi:hypothetical protein